MTNFCPDCEYIRMFGRARWIETRATLGAGFESGDKGGRSEYEPQPFGGSTSYAGGELSGVQTDLAMRILTDTSREIPIQYTLRIQYKGT